MYFGLSYVGILSLFLFRYPILENNIYIKLTVLSFLIGHSDIVDIHINYRKQLGDKNYLFPHSISSSRPGTGSSERSINGGSSSRLSTPSILSRAQLCSPNYTGRSTPSSTRPNTPSAYSASASASVTSHATYDGQIARQR